MALSAWLSVHPVFLNSMLIMFTTCQGRQDMIQISAFMLYDAWDVAEETFSAGALMTGKAQNQMSGAIFRPEPSQAKHSTSLHQPPASQRKVFVLFPPSGAQSDPITLPASWSFLSAITPAGWSPDHWRRAQPERDTVGLSDLWAVAACESSDTCLIHICSGTHGWLIWACACLGSHGVCVSEKEWGRDRQREREREKERERERERERARERERGGLASLHLRRISRRVEKNELISLSSGGISPNLFPS